MRRTAQFKTMAKTFVGNQETKSIPTKMWFRRIGRTSGARARGWGGLRLQLPGALEGGGVFLGAAAGATVAIGAAALVWKLWGWVKFGVICLGFGELLLNFFGFLLEVISDCLRFEMLYRVVSLVWDGSLKLIPWILRSWFNPVWGVNFAPEVKPDRLGHGEPALKLKTPRSHHDFFTPWL